MVYIFYTIFTLLLVYYQKYQLKETRAALTGNIPELAKANKMWHRYGLALRLTVIVIFTLHFIPILGSNLFDIALAGGINILVFEFGINKIALNRDWFYVGNTAEIDKKFGKTKWLIMFGIFFLTLIAKIISIL